MSFKKMSRKILIFIISFSLLVINIGISAQDANEAVHDDNTYYKNNDIPSNISKQQDKSTIYISQNGSGNKDGLSVENAKSVNEINELTGDLEIVVLETITLNDNMPDANMTFIGFDDNSTIKTNQYISFNGDVTFKDINYNDNGFTYMFANGNNLTFTESVKAATSNIFIFGGGNKIDIEGNPTITIETNFLGASIFGGGWISNLKGNPTINIKNATFSNVYGGGYARGGDAKVFGNPKINLTKCDITGKNYINGGGYALLSSNLNADVDGKVTIIIDECKMNESGDLYLGSRIETNSSSATIKELNVNIQNSTLGKMVFGGGYCTGDNSVADIIKSNIRIIDSTINGELYAGGYTDDSSDNNNYSARINESEINLINTKVSKVFAGGYKNGTDINTSKLNFENIEDTAIFAGGYKDYSKVDNCQMNISNSSSKGTGFNMVVNGGGGITPNGALYDTVNNLRVNFEGNNTIKSIKMVDNITLKEGSILEQLTPDIDLFSDINMNGNVIIEENSQLLLKGSNEILGNFDAYGNLYNTFDGMLLVGGNVISNNKASYTSSNFKKTYDNNYPFLASKSDDLNQIANFVSTDDSYFVENRDSNDENFKTDDAFREWYLNTDTYSLTYKYEGDVPENAPTLPESSFHKTGSEVTIAETPRLDGYRFDGWQVKYPENIDIDKGKIIMPNENVELIGSWFKEISPIDPTIAVYKIEHYIEENDNNYKLMETEFPLYDKIGKTISASPKDYDGYVYNKTKSISTGIIFEPYMDGNEVKYLVLKIYYDKIENPKPIFPDKPNIQESTESNNPEQIQNEIPKTSTH